MRRKLNTIEEQFAGKTLCSLTTVLFVDDSIVRGTTPRQIVLMAREAGAKGTFFASCTPSIKGIHIYDINLASSSELLAHHRSVHEIANTLRIR